MSNAGRKDGTGARSGKEQKIVARNMSRALRMLSEQLGTDAVLLSSRRVENGVEIVGLPPGESPSTSDYNQLHSERRKRDRRAQLRRSSDQQATVSVRVSEERRQRSSSSDEQSPLAKTGERDAGDLRQTASVLAEQVRELSQSASETPSAMQPVALNAVIHKLDDVCGMIEQTLDRQQPALFPPPDQYIVTSRLLAMGLLPNIVHALVDGICADSVATFWEAALQRLQRVLPVLEESVLDAGGVYALVGPADSGKSSLIVKCIAQYALEGRAAELAVIHCGDRPPARLSRMSAVAKIPLMTVSGQYSLADRVLQCARYKTVLIDGPVDKDCARYREAVGTVPFSVKEIIVLPATGEIRYLKSMLKHYRSKRSMACALSDYDNCRSIGELISLLLTERLNIAFLNGSTFAPESLSVPQRTNLLEQLKGSDSSELDLPVQVPILSAYADRTVIADMP